MGDEQAKRLRATTGAFWVCAFLVAVLAATSMVQSRTIDGLTAANEALLRDAEAVEMARASSRADYEVCETRLANQTLAYNAEYRKWQAEIRRLERPVVAKACK